MSDLDPKGLEAAGVAALETYFGKDDDNSYRFDRAIEAAIRAYEAHRAFEGYRWVKFIMVGTPPRFQHDDEAHKASAVKGRHDPSCPWLHPTYGDCTCGEHARRDEAHKASAVPDEVREEVVDRLHELGHLTDYLLCHRAADLLEQMARELNKRHNQIKTMEKENTEYRKEIERTGIGLSRYSPTLATDQEVQEKYRDALKSGTQSQSDDSS